MKTIILVVMTMTLMASAAMGETYRRSFPFDLKGCKQHLRAVARAVKDAGGEVRKSDASGKSYRMKLKGITTIYTCTRHELLETEL